MQFFRDSKRGLQKVVRSNVETWIEHAAEVRMRVMSWPLTDTDEELSACIKAHATASR